jgi:uncharacterized membrane protein
VLFRDPGVRNSMKRPDPIKATVLVTMRSLRRKTFSWLYAMWLPDGMGRSQDFPFG